MRSSALPSALAIVQRTVAPHERLVQFAELPEGVRHERADAATPVVVVQLFREGLCLAHLLQHLPRLAELDSARAAARGGSRNPPPGRTAISGSSRKSTQGLLEEIDRLAIGRPARCKLTCPPPVAGSLRKACRGEMVGSDLGRGFDPAVGKRSTSTLAMLACSCCRWPLSSVRVGGVLHQCVLERVGRVRRRAATVR